MSAFSTRYTAASLGSEQYASLPPAAPLPEPDEPLACLVPRPEFSFRTLVAEHDHLVVVREVLGA
jgi:hypothetical protein